MRVIPPFIVACALSAGCDSQPNDGARSESHTFFEAVAKNARMPQVDLVFAIDDSPSMADKQALLAPQLSAMVSRLLSPRCYADEPFECSSSTQCGKTGRCDFEGITHRCFVTSNLGVCPAGTRAEFPAVHDLHVGVVRSDARFFGGSIERTKAISGLGGGFLAWLPRSVVGNVNKPAPNVTAYGDGEEKQLLADFASLLAQVGVTGSGFESQLESWYGALIGTDADAAALAMRHDFLRPHSRVVIVQVTDEDDGSIDPLALDGGASFLKQLPLGPRGTSACDVDPSSKACSSCAFSQNASDPSCTSCAGGLASCPTPGWYAEGQDSLDVRFTDDMKRRYGLDVLHPVERYVDALRLTTVDGCTNPLFASTLPDGSDTSKGALCALPLGDRTADLLSYVLIGGIAPSRLVDANGSFKPILAANDWDALVGSPRDPHMIESIAARATLQPPSTTYTLGTDPDHGREWTTTNAAGVGDLSTSVDLQFACTFDLPSPRDCTNEAPCDCAPGSPGASAADGPPLCDPSARTTQVRGKAYPSTRELRVAKGLGAQAAVRSICTPWTPALLPLFESLGARADGQCFPETLHYLADCTVSCKMLVVYFGQTDQRAGCTDPGTSQPDAVTLDWFRNRWLAQIGESTVPVVCTYRQLAAANADCSGTCAASPDAGFCYVVGPENTGGCPGGIAFGGDGPPPNTVLDLVCVQ